MDTKEYSKRPPQMKVNEKWIDLNRCFAKGVGNYLTADAVRDALVVAKRIWYRYLKELSNGWKPNPLEENTDPNLRAALEAMGWLGTQEEINQAHQAYLAKLESGETPFDDGLTSFEWSESELAPVTVTFAE